MVCPSFSPRPCNAVAMEYRVVFRSPGLIDRSKGKRLAKIDCNSTLVVTRSDGITSPSRMGVVEGSSTSLIEMNFCPNKVVGMISIVELFGITLAASGCRATRIDASLLSWLMLRTCPTSTPCRRTSP
jgi:hypothetical protein